MADWDDEDFEPETASLAPPPAPAPEPIQQSGKPVAPKKKEINMESLNRELTAAEREEMQRRSDLRAAKELFGMGEGDESESVSYAEILHKEEFEEWGTKVGTFLATRHKAAHYGDLINKLILSVSEKLDASEIRKISTHLKALADTKKDDKPKGPAAAVGNKKKKVALKGAGAKGSDYYDYEGGGKGGSYGAYDDFEDDFM